MVGGGGGVWQKEVARRDAIIGQLISQSQWPMLFSSLSYRSFLYAVAKMFQPLSAEK